MSLPTRKVGTTAVTGVYYDTYCVHAFSRLTIRSFGPAIGYGAMAIGGAVYGAAAPDEERFKVAEDCEYFFGHNDSCIVFQLLDRLVEIGCTNWDTAPPCMSQSNVPYFLPGLLADPSARRRFRGAPRQVVRT